MTIEHRFYKEDSLPKREIDYLFIGTFSPDLDKSEAKWYYERKANNFWPVIVQVFKGKLDYDEMGDPGKLKKYAKSNKFGFTDLIVSVESRGDVKDFREDIETFSDNKIEQYKIKFHTDSIIKYLKKHKNIKAVFFTRSTSSGIYEIQKEWERIEQECVKLKIRTDRLKSPSRGGARAIYDDWKKKINI